MRWGVASGRRRSCAYGLVELLVVIAIGAILASIALPSFEQHLRKARRTDAVMAARRVQTAQERHRGVAPVYGSLDQIGLADTSDAAHYRLDITRRDGEGYELFLLAVGSQAHDRECRVLKLQVRRLTLTHLSGPDAGVANPPQANRRCWGL